MVEQIQMSSKRRMTRNRILTAARELFSEHGYNDTTVRGIASLAEVSAATVILYGGSKEALFESLYRNEVDHIFSKALATVPPPAPLPIQLAHVFTALISFFDKERVAGRVLLRLQMFDSEDANGMRQGLTELVQGAQQTGRVRGDLNPELVASTALHFYTGCLADMLRAPDSNAELTLYRLRSMLRLLEEGMSPWR
jgi:AcrR family transcriptional regulator